MGACKDCVGASSGWWCRHPGRQEGPGQVQLLQVAAAATALGLGGDTGAGAGAGARNGGAAPVTAVAVASAHEMQQAWSTLPLSNRTQPLNALMQLGSGGAGQKHRRRRGGGGTRHQAHDEGHRKGSPSRATRSLGAPAQQGHFGFQIRSRRRIKYDEDWLAGLEHLLHPHHICAQLQLRLQQCSPR